MTLHDYVRDPNNHIVSIYSHGNEICICDHNEDVIVQLSDAPNYSETIFYSMACMTAQGLGKAMQTNNCTLYYGFDNESYYVDDNDPYLESFFINTHNFALRLLLSGITDPEKIIEETTNYFLNIVDEIRDIYPAWRGLIRDNLDRITILANGKIFKRK